MLLATPVLTDTRPPPYTPQLPGIYQEAPSFDLDEDSDVGVYGDDVEFTPGYANVYAYGNTLENW